MLSDRSGWGQGRAGAFGQIGLHLDVGFLEEVNEDCEVRGLIPVADLFVESLGEPCVESSYIGLV